MASRRNNKRPDEDTNVQYTSAGSLGGMVNHAPAATQLSRGGASMTGSQQPLHQPPAHPASGPSNSDTHGHIPHELPGHQESQAGRAVAHGGAPHELSTGQEAGRAVGSGPALRTHHQLCDDKKALDKARAGLSEMSKATKAARRRYESVNVEYGDSHAINNAHEAYKEAAELQQQQTEHIAKLNRIFLADWHASKTDISDRLVALQQSRTSSVNAIDQLRTTLMELNNLVPEPERS